MFTSQQLEESYNFCRKLSKNRALSRYGYLFLSQAKKDGSYVLYAWGRILDDIVDDPKLDRPIKEQKIKSYAVVTKKCLQNKAITKDEIASYPWIPALRKVFEDFKVPLIYPFEMIKAQEKEFKDPTYQTFNDVYQYCYGVSSTFGLMSVHIWGIEEKYKKETFEQGVKLGIAVQLTNIIRDIYRDAKDGCLYLPIDHFQGAANNKEEIIKIILAKDLTILLPIIRELIKKTEAFFEESYDLTSLIHRDGKLCVSIIRETYKKLLNKIKRDPNIIFSDNKVCLSMWEKIGFLIKGIINK